MQFIEPGMEFIKSLCYSLIPQCTSSQDGDKESQKIIKRLDYNYNLKQTGTIHKLDFFLLI